MDGATIGETNVEISDFREHIDVEDSVDMSDDYSKVC